MEPNPSVYLRAIRDQTLSEDLLGAGLASGASRIILLRAAECLAQLTIRHEQLPALMREQRAAQMATLHAIAHRLEGRGVSVPESLTRAAECAQTAPANPGENDVLMGDRINEGLADGIRALRAQGTLTAEDSEFLTAICRTICEAEVKLRDSYEQELDRLRRSADQDSSPLTTVLPAPTEAGLTAYLRRRLPAEPTLVAGNVQRLVGDNSKDIFFFETTASRGFNGAYVMRREPAYNVTQAKLADEYDLMSFLGNTALPVPRALLGERDTAHFGGGFIITERVTGATRTAAQLGANARTIMKDLARLCAEIHGLNIPRNLPQFSDASLSTRDRMLARIDALYRRWLDERSEDSTIIESAYQWLHDNVDCLDDTAVLTHGDYNLRNVLLDGDRIAAILDWELCRVSHPAEDLSYIRRDVEGVMPWQEYLSAYRSHSGSQVTDAALFYFEVWAMFWTLVIAASVYSGYHLGKHRNFVFACVACVEYPMHLRKVARLLAEHCEMADP